MRKNGPTIELTTSDLEIQIRTRPSWAATPATWPPRWARAS
jgi:hypothetical protein